MKIRIQIKLALAILWLIDLAIILLGGWKLRRLQSPASWKTKEWRWEKTVIFTDGIEYTYLLKVHNAAETQEDLWRTGS